MTANDVSRIGSVPLFQGQRFSKTPENQFGWVLTYLAAAPVESKRTPGNEQDDRTGHFYNNYEIVQVFDVQQVNEVDWYLVGPDEWLPHSVVARVLPNTTPPQGVTGDRWIEVNLYEQTLSVYEGRQLVFATLIASGLDPFWTRPGLFQIFQKVDSTPMRGSFEIDRSDAYYLEDVPWTMYFDEARALHGAYWRANLGFPQSHGCVNLSVGDSAWLYDWANNGDWVYVWDPSGRTPVDPSQYTAGGA
jgi:lipoprotein-anchoring transpeptidase ErfK/SrfK